MKAHLLLPLLALISLFPCTGTAQDAGLGRHRQLYVVPAPGKVTVDGKLDDWDLSGQIGMFVNSASREMQSAKFALMYDREALYISGVVRDPNPMMNRHDPAVTGDRGWDADSCQFRITLDPSHGYPERENVFDYRGKDAKSDTRDDIRHLTLWYYTDKDEPALGMKMGMGYRLPHPEWTLGVVPLDKYQAKYVKADDGNGYTFEYRIPWSTLGAKAPLKGGDLVAGTVQFNWGTPDGLKTGGGSAWAYDVMAHSGFAFQDASVWGKIIFSGTGHVAQDLVEAGVPGEKPKPLGFSYDLPADGQITLQLFDQDSLVRRVLLAQADRSKGHHVEEWDGMDDQGKPLPAGAYECRGVIHDPIRTKFLFSAHNSGQPPYPTDDGKGGWGGDHGNPTACAALPDGGMLLSWEACEYGWGVIRVDADGRKQWGIRNSARLLASNGKRFYIYDPTGFQSADGIQVLDAADGRPLNFGNGNPLLTAPPGGDAASNQATGLACGNGKIYVSYGKRNLIGVFDSETGRLEATWPLVSPGVLAARSGGSLIAASGGTLVALDNGKVSKLNDHDLDTPTGIAVNADGTIYVANRGLQQDIAVLDSSGKLLRRFGKPGGRPAVGDYNPNGVYQPDGIAIDTANRLWVAEQADSPKRISVWNTATGAFEREFFGGSSYFGYAFINPAVPDEIYCHNVLWRIDWDRNTVTPTSTIWRKTAPDMVGEPDPSAYPQGFRSLTAANGSQYGLGISLDGRWTVLYRRDGNEFKPFLASFEINRASKGWHGLGSPELDDPAKTPDGWYIWQDENDDQRLQSGELCRLKDKNIRLNLKAMAPDMTIWIEGGYLLKPVRWLKNGQPVYDPAKLERSFLAGNPIAGGYIWLDPDGGVYTCAPGRRLSLAKWSPAGKMEWGYPGIVDWHNALGMSLVTAGRLQGITGPLGVAGNFTGNMSYFGVCHIFQRDGICVAALMHDGRAGGQGPEAGQPEGQGGDLVSVVTKKGEAPRTLLLGGGQDGRVTEVLGLDTVRPLPSRKFVITEQDSKTAVEALAEYNARYGIGSSLVIADGLKALDAAGAVSKTLDGSRGFSVTAARDDKNLYVSFDVTSPNDLINAVSDPTLVFKGGNCLDIQLAADPSAGPARKTPFPGDMRLLVTRQIAPDGKTARPLAVLYRPKVSGFSGQPVTLTSPTGRESFDEITLVTGVGLEYRKTPDGFKAVVTIPLKLTGLSLKKGGTVKMDVGYIFGNATGSQAAARSYWMNGSFNANVVNDVPCESRLEPAKWGEATVE